MKRFSILALVALSLAIYFQAQSPAETEKSAANPAGADKKAEAILKQMADYLGGLPAMACKIDASFDVKADKEEPIHQATTMTARLERPNKLALIVDSGNWGLTTVSDGKNLTNYLPPLKRYSVGEVNGDYAQMTDVGVPLKINILGAQGSVIPFGGDEYFKRLVSGVESSKYVGIEKVGKVSCHHLHFVERRFDWDVWIEDGKQPVVDKVVLDLSKQITEEKVSIMYTVSFSDWNVAPKFKEADFTFKAPASAQQVDELIEPDPPHPLLGKNAPAFKTVDVDGHPFDLKSELGKNVILLDFWSTSCGPCVMLMPELEALAQKYADRGLVYRAVNGGEDAESIKQFLTATKIKAPIVLDPNLEIWRSYGVQPIPQTVLIGKDGKVQAVHVGYGEALAGEISGEIDALLAGKDLAGPELAKFNKSQKKRPAPANTSPASAE